MNKEDIFPVLPDERNEERHLAILKNLERNDGSGSEVCEENDWLEQPSPLKLVDSITVYGLNNSSL